MAQNNSATLVIHNGRIATLDAAMPAAGFVAVQGDRIAATGPESSAAKWIGPQTRVIDLGGRLAIPGFIEGHAHFTGIGEFRMGLDLRGAKTWDEIVAAVAQAAKQARPGEWIVGRGWHQSKWIRAPQPNVEGFPLHASLSAAAPANPVLLTHASGHAAFVNAKAMEAAGITRGTANPAGGEILKDAQGNPTGLLREAAQELASNALESWRAKRPAAEREAELRHIIQLAQDECLSKGITSFEDAGSPLAVADVFRDMARKNELRLRLWVMLGGSNAELAPALDKYRVIGEGDNHLTIRAIKRYMDGALGSRGAWLLEPYADQPNSTGLNETPPSEIRAAAEMALAHGYQLSVHAIGDRANRETLNIYEQVFRAHPEMKDLRWRIEHAQHLSPVDIPRFGQLGVIAAMQGIHATSDAPFVIERLGAQRAAEGAYAWRKLIDSGAVVGNGTDSPVEDVSPLANFYASVTRKGADGKAFFPEQKMTREEALRSYTWNNAYAAFEEKLKGSLQPGKLADITVLSRDILTVPEEQILTTTVDYTIVGGKVEFERK